jgi:hypothetical protein
MSESQRTPEAVPSVIHKRPNWIVDNGLPFLVLGFLVLVLFSVGAVRQLHAYEAPFAVQAD